MKAIILTRYDLSILIAMESGAIQCPRSRPTERARSCQYLVTAGLASQIRARSEPKWDGYTITTAGRRHLDKACRVPR